MKRTLIAATLVLVSGSALADEGFPQPSFNDHAAVPAQAVTSNVTIDQQFPKNGVALGGPTGPATVLAQSVEGTKQITATVVQPSFNG